MTSRRDFLQGAGAISAAVASASVNRVAMAALPEPVVRELAELRVRKPSGGHAGH